ncbi:integrase core domain-containing protein [Variovorax jilinensis]|uniref:integrase core domain-containing protein n=1 Tax=Variovorax jilinensis TaxID=3053513 RepID=UPI004037B08E
MTFWAKAPNEWAWRRDVKLNYTIPGKPKDNGLIQSFNGRLRDEFLNVNEYQPAQTPTLEATEKRGRCHTALGTVSLIADGWT